LIDRLCDGPGSAEMIVDESYADRAVTDCSTRTHHTR
jgi:hypothetical protein